MYPVSTTFLNELSSESQRVVVTAEVLAQGVVIAKDLKVVSGNVQVDSTATTRRRLSCTVIDPTGVLIPNDSNDALSPYGDEIRVFRGYAYADGTTELIPLGVFRISDADVSDDGSAKVELSGFDRARAVQRARFEVPYVVTSGTNYITAIQNLIVNRIGSVGFSSITTSATTQLLVFDQLSDPWEAVTKMADSISCEVFFNMMGECVIRTKPNLPNTAPVFTYAEGVNSVLISVNNKLTDEPGYNGVVVDGEPPNGPPVHSVRYDTDSSSGTYYLGPYGKVPMFYKSSFIYTQAQADEAADSMLRERKGGTESLRFAALPNPALEGGDVVRVTRGAIGVDDHYLIESFTIPLDTASTMSVSTRKRKTI